MSSVFLYELAIELGEHSNDLVEVASMIGVVDAGPASKLDAEQIAQLRAHFGAATAGPPPPPLPNPGAPLPPAGRAGSGPVAPASWGPPAPPPAPAAPTSPAVSGAPPTWGPPGTPTFEAPADPPMGAGPVPDPAPVLGDAPQPGRRWSPAQLGALGGVAAVVLVLFGFMVLNTGPDEERQEALEAREQELAAATTEWVPPETTTTTEAPVVTAAPMPRAVPGGISGGGATDDAPDDLPPAPVDQTRFCAGVRSIIGLESEIAQIFVSGDIEGLRAAIARHRRDWDVGVEHMAAGASDRDRPLIEEYRQLYLAMFGSIERAASTLEVTEFLQANYTQEQVDVADPVNETAAAYCT